MTNDRFIELLSRKLSGEATLQELEEIQELVAADPQFGERVGMIEKYWKENEESGPTYIEEAFEKLKLRLSPKPGDDNLTPKRPDKLLVAGMIAFAAIITRLFYKKHVITTI